MKKTLAAAVAAASLMVILPTMANAETTPAPSPTATTTTSTEYSGEVVRGTATTNTFALVTTPTKRTTVQKFTVSSYGEVVIETSWKSTEGSNSTTLLDATGQKIAATGFHASPFKQKLVQTLEPGTYQISVNGDYKVTSSHNVVVTQTPLTRLAKTRTWTANTTPTKRTVTQDVEFLAPVKVDFHLKWASPNAASFNLIDRATDKSVGGFTIHASPFKHDVSVTVPAGQYTLKLNGDYKNNATYDVTYDVQLNTVTTPTKPFYGNPTTQVDRTKRGVTQTSDLTLTTTPKAKVSTQPLKVTQKSEVVLNASWNNGLSSSITLLDSAGKKVAGTSFHGSPYKDSIKTTVPAGDYTISVSGDYYKDTTVQVKSSVTPVDMIIPRMPAGDAFPFANSEWTRDISTAPLAKNSAAISADIQDQVKRYYGQAAFNSHQYNSSWYQVPAEQPRADVKFDDCQKKGYVPYTLFQNFSTQDTSISAAVRPPAVTVPGHFKDVPIPADAIPAIGTDGAIAIYSPSTDQLWEFWKANKQADGWHACWGGRIDQVSKSKGYFLTGMGTSATGTASAAGAISVEEAEKGQIDHALSLIVPETLKGTFSWPAQRTDGQVTRAGAVAEGQRLRLDPSFNVDASNLHPIAKAAAKAAQKYGIIVTDKGGAVAFVSEAGDAVKKETGVDPWKKLQTKPGATKPTPDYDVFKGFPWDKVQVLPMDYGRP